MGYQAPGSFDAFWKSKDGGSEKRKRTGHAKKHTKSNLSPEEFAALGLRTASSQKQSFAKSKQSSERTEVAESSTKDKTKDDKSGGTTSS
ncbi:hypothetical protein C0J52_08267 [Blattella germanica]|nr:hypothetical protein C0J52_08267 [Blattella germanica]